MSTSPKGSKSLRLASDVQLAAGLKGHFADADPLGFTKDAPTVADVLAPLTARADATRATDAAEAAWRNAVKAERKEVADSDRVLRGVRAFLRATLGEESTLLVDFGLSPKTPPRALTAEEKQAAVEKRAATRKARMVMGSRQRQKVLAPEPTAAADPAPAVTPKPASPGAG